MTGTGHSVGVSSPHVYLGAGPRPLGFWGRQSGPGNNLTCLPHCHSSASSTPGIWDKHPVSDTPFSCAHATCSGLCRPPVLPSMYTRPPSFPPVCAPWDRGLQLHHHCSLTAAIHTEEASSSPGSGGWGSAVHVLPRALPAVVDGALLCPSWSSSWACNKAQPSSQAAPYRG